MSSCSNPEAGSAALMQRQHFSRSLDNRPASLILFLADQLKFDKSGTCVKVQVESRKHRRPTCCVLQVRFVQLSRSQVIISVSRECFSPLITTKVKRILEPTVNPTTNRTRRKALKADGNLFLAFSGDLGSTVLLGLVSKCYFTPADEDDKNPRGGKNHPRNGNVWERVFVCYVEMCASFPEMH
jgi:hypothetical protein